MFYLVRTTSEDNHKKTSKHKGMDINNNHCEECKPLFDATKKELIQRFESKT